MIRFGPPFSPNDPEIEELMAAARPNAALLPQSTGC
jgi:hypothetical protein